MVIIKMPERIKPRFSRSIGIDYSGAETADSSLKGLRVYEASRESMPVEVEPPPSTPTSISFATVQGARARPVPAAPAGGGSPRSGPGPSRSFTSTCPVR